MAVLCVVFFAGVPFFLKAGNLTPVENRLYSRPRSRVVRDRNGEVLRVTLSEDGEFLLPIPLKDMGKYLPRIAVEVEDRRFYSHHGIDFLRLAAALYGNLKAGRVTSGASTISSQIVRLACPAARTPATKLLEFSRAVRLEMRHSKSELLEMYLNAVALGGNYRGVEAASHAWFGCSAKELSPAGAALLVAMIKGPGALRPDVFPRRVKARRDLILSMMAERGIISSPQLRDALREPLPERMLSLPNSEILFCERVLALSDALDVTSTLDVKLQMTLRSVLEGALASFPPGITAAGVLIENSSGAVRAYVANAARGHAGASAPWVDCASSPRSPGSALKPFVYACAVEDGLITPRTLLADTPLDMSGRAPRNFDRKYRGPVTAAAALVDSLNVPAVRMLRAVGHERFLFRLRRLGFDTLTGDAPHYGDSLILGGCEVSPLALAGAATALACGGMLKRPLFTGDAVCVPEQVFSEAAAAIITHILADRRRMPPLLQNVAPRRGHFAFKTGTSYGLRDAWTVGWNHEWTLAVWLGHPRGSPHSDLVGISAATPAVMEFFRSLPPSDFPPLPESVGWRDVCSLSGKIPGPLCPHTVKDLYIRNVSRSGVCRMHALENGRTVVVWPQELSGYVGSRREKRKSLNVASPLEGAEYLLADEGTPLLLKAEGTGTLHWFVDGLHVGSSTSWRSLQWKMKPGRHTASVIDEKGRRKNVPFSVYTPDSNPVRQLQGLIEE